MFTAQFLLTSLVVVLMPGTGTLYTISTGIALNVLNPKLTVFFLAFLPQFITCGGVSATQQFIGLSAVFMLMTLAVFCLYGFVASSARRVLGATPRAMRWVQRSFAVVFGGLAIELAFTRR
jgi:threonine/homoserine/homoserine lactone efflux protein